MNGEASAAAGMPCLRWAARVTPGRRPLVLLHGFTGGAADWEPVVARLDRRQAVIAPWLPGHHPAFPADPARGFDGALDDLARGIAGAAGGGVTLCGYSLGARLALALAVRRPDLVEGAVLVGCHPGLADPRERAERAAADARWAALLRERGIAAFVDAWQALPLFATQARLARERLERQRTGRLQHDPAALASALDMLSLAAMPDFGPGLPAVRLPVELVAGEEDAKFRQLAEVLRAGLPDARVHVIPRVGHNVVLEAPAALAAVIDDAAG